MFVKKTCLDCNRSLASRFLASTAPKRRRPAFRLPWPSIEEEEEGFIIPTRFTCSISQEISRASKKIGPAASDGKRFDAITTPRLTFTLEMMPRGKVSVEVFD